MCILKTPAVAVMLVMLLSALPGGCATMSLKKLPPVLGEVESCAEIVREMEATNTFCTRSKLRSRLVGGDATRKRNWPRVYAAWESVTVRRQALEDVFAERSCGLPKPSWGACVKPCYGFQSGHFWGLDAEDPCFVLCDGFRRRDIAEP